jgi:hypothetical protein
MRLPACLFAVASGFRVSLKDDTLKVEANSGLNGMPGLEPQCQCSDTGIVGDVDTGKAGCDQHFGRKFGYLCYIEGGAECAFAKKGRVGVFYRPCKDEHKRDKAQHRLLASLEGIDAELVRELLQDAKAAHVDEDTLKAGEERIGQIAEMLEVRAELLKELEGFNTDRLKNLAEQAEEFELYEFMDYDIPAQIEARIDFLESKDDREDDVKDAIKGKNLPKLQKAIEAAIAVQAADSVVQAGQKREQELIGQRKQIKEDLLQAIEGWDLDRLKSLAEEAEDHKDLYDELPRDVPDRIMQRVEFLKSAGKKEAALREAMKGVNAEELQDAIDTVAEVRGDSDLLDIAKQRKQELIVKLDLARKALEEALEGFNLDKLEQAVRKAKMLAIITKDDNARIKQRIEFLNTAGKKEATLRMAMEGVDAEKLQDAMDAFSEVHGGRSELVESAKKRKEELLVELDTGRKNLDEALKGFDLDDLKQALDEAKRLNIVTKEDKKIAKGRSKYLEVIAGDSLGLLLRTIREYEASGEYPDITDLAQERVKEIRHYMHNQKMKVKRLVESGTDPDELEAELAEGLRMRAFGKDLKIAAEEKIAQLRAADGR